MQQLYNFTVEYNLNTQQLKSHLGAYMYKRYNSTLKSLVVSVEGGDLEANINTTWILILAPLHFSLFYFEMIERLKKVCFT